MAKEDKDKLLRLIIGIILVLASLPGFSMSTGMGCGMMGYCPYLGFSFIGALISLGLLALGIYLIAQGLEK